jgi:protease-4
MPRRKAAALGAVFLLSLCASAAALGQGFSSSPGNGVPLPAEAHALDDGATSLSQSPGSLAFVRALELDYVRSQAYGDQGASGDGLFLAGALGPLALGVSTEWIRPELGCFGATCSTRARRVSLGAGLRFGIAGVGAVRHSFSSDESYLLDKLSSWDLGLVLRPHRALSLSFAALDVDAPRFGPADLQRRYVVGLGVHAFGERLALGADAVFLQCSDDAALAASQPCGAGNPGLRFTGDFAFARGVHALAQASRDAQLQRWSGQLALGIDFGHLGLRYSQTLRPEQGAQGALRLRLSQESWPAVSLGGHAALLELDKALEAPKSSLLSALFGGARSDPHAQTLAALERLARDESVRAVVLRTSGIPGGLGKAEELRRGIAGLRASGKKVVFFLDSAGDLEYYVASVADRILAAPQAVLLINGFSATALFAAEGLSKLGVKAEFVRVGAYKNAPDLFSRKDMSAEQREVENALLEDVYGRFVHAVSERRHLGEEKVKVLLDRGILRPGEAVEGGLLDGLGYPDQLEEEVGKLLGGRVPLQEVSASRGSVREERWGPRARIALVRIEGTIAGGESKSDPLGVSTTSGATTVAKQIRKAADDPGVRAIVVRIDSPGGDGTASDLIWRELQRARKEKGKPVVASMGDVAASGGYYVAAGCDEIWAEPSTITGSIGVFAIKFDASELYEKIGVKLETVKRGRSADIFSTTRPSTEEERKLVQGWVDDFYATFVARVSEARGLSRDEVDKLARGRIWTGLQAQERKLVDRLGGLEEALAAARARAGLGAEDAVDIEDEGRAAALELADLATGTAQAPLSWAGPLPKREAIRALKSLELLGEPGTVRAVLPYLIEVR